MVEASAETTGIERYGVRALKIQGALDSFANIDGLAPFHGANDSVYFFWVVSAALRPPATFSQPSSLPLT